MEPKITVQDKYILVEHLESEFWDILRTLERLFEIPDYTVKNVIWVFRKGSLKTTYEELYKLKEYVIKKLPDNFNPDRKTAIVVKTGLYEAMATEYIKIGKDLPGVTFKVFSDLSAAKEWIKSG